MSGFATIARGGSGTGINGQSNNAASTSQFGETLVAQLTPSAQAIMTQGINFTQFVTASIGTGASVTTADHMAIMQSGTSTTGSASVSLRRGVRYRAGQGSLGRMTAVFGTPVANTYQVAGLGNVVCGFYFGYKSTDFGVFHFTDGVRETRMLDVDTGVANGTSVTITLNGGSRTYTINGASNVNQTAWEISQQDYMDVGGGWVAEAYGDKVYFIALRSGPRSGTYSISDPGATFSQITAGVVNSETFVSQSLWNLDTMDGNGPSRFELNPQKGNVYQVGFQYLGFGNTRFAIEDPSTGQFQPVHMIEQSNVRTTPVLTNPFVSALWAASNAGSTTPVTLKGASAATFTEGAVLQNVGAAFSIAATKASVTNSEVPVLTIRPDRLFAGEVGYGEVDIARFFSTSTETGNHSITIKIYKNLRLTGPTNFQFVNQTQSSTAYDTAATGFSLNNSTLIATYLLRTGNPGSLLDIDLKGDNFFLSVGEMLTVTAVSSNAGGSPVTLALSWFEHR